MDHFFFPFGFGPFSSCRCPLLPIAEATIAIAIFSSLLPTIIIIVIIGFIPFLHFSQPQLIPSVFLLSIAISITSFFDRQPPPSSSFFFLCCCVYCVAATVAVPSLLLLKLLLWLKPIIITLITAALSLLDRSSSAASALLDRHQRISFPSVFIFTITIHHRHCRCCCHWCPFSFPSPSSAPLTIIFGGHCRIISSSLLLVSHRQTGITTIDVFSAGFSNWQHLPLSLLMATAPSPSIDGSPFAFIPSYSIVIFNSIFSPHGFDQQHHLVSLDRLHHLCVAALLSVCCFCACCYCCCFDWLLLLLLGGGR